MSSKQQLFPGVNPRSILVKPTKATFSAPLVGGKFLFENQKVIIDELPINNGALISGVDFSSNINQLLFSDAIDKDYSNGYFTLDIIREGNGLTVNQAPFPFTSFQQLSGFVSEFMANATTESGQEEISLVLNGQLIQTNDLIVKGIDEISIFSSFNMFRSSVAGLFGC